MYHYKKPSQQQHFKPQYNPQSQSQPPYYNNQNIKNHPPYPPTNNVSLTQSQLPQNGHTNAPPGTALHPQNYNNYKNKPQVNRNMNSNQLPSLPPVNGVHQQNGQPNGYPH